MDNTEFEVIDTKGDNIFEVANGICETNSSDNLCKTEMYF